MKVVSVTEFKAHCLRLIEEMGRTREPIEITKRGKKVGVLSPPAELREVSYEPGQFKDEIRILGDLDDLGVEWEALK